jgi:hypothetical protein
MNSLHRQECLAPSGRGSGAEPCRRATRNQQRYDSARFANAVRQPFSSIVASGVSLSPQKRVVRVLFDLI